MATKKEVWVSEDGTNHSTELKALASDLLDQFGCDKFDFEQDPTTLTAEQVAAIDAIHEYAHRGAPAWRPALRRELVLFGDYWTVGGHTAEIVGRDADGNFVDSDGDRFSPDGLHLYGVCAGGYGRRPNYDIDWEVSP